MSMENGFELDPMPLDEFPPSRFDDANPAIAQGRVRPFVPEEVREREPGQFWTKASVRPSTAGKHSLSFTTLTKDGSETTTVRLTKADLLDAWYAIGRYILNEPDQAERTTTINYDEEGPYAEIITYSRTLITSLRKNEAAMEVGTYPEGRVCFKILKKLVSVRNPRKARKPMSEEQRAAARDRLASARATKNSGQGLSGTRPDTSE